MEVSPSVLFEGEPIHVGHCKKFQNLVLISRDINNVDRSKNVAILRNT